MLVYSAEAGRTIKIHHADETLAFFIPHSFGRIFCRYHLSNSWVQHCFICINIIITFFILVH